jgi:glutamate-1-semialdehyde 2,1-aminomutase
MQYISPLGNVPGRHFSGNPIAMIAGYTTLTVLSENPSIYSELEKKTAICMKG